MHAQLDVSWRMIVSSSMSQFSPSKKIFGHLQTVLRWESSLYVCWKKNTITSRVDLVCRSSTLLVLKYLSHTNLGPIHCLSRLFLPTKITRIKLFPSKQSQKMFPSNLFILVFENYVFSVDCAFCTLFAPKSR